MKILYYTEFLTVLHLTLSTSQNRILIENSLFSHMKKNVLGNVSFGRQLASDVFGRSVSEPGYWNCFEFFWSSKYGGHTAHQLKIYIVIRKYISRSRNIIETEETSTEPMFFLVLEISKQSRPVCLG